MTTVLRETGRGFARSHAVDPGRVSTLMWTAHGRSASPRSSRSPAGQEGLGFQDSQWEPSSLPQARGLWPGPVAS